MLRIQETVKNLRLTVNRQIPVLEDQVIAGRKRFIEAQNCVIQNASFISPASQKTSPRSLARET